MKVIIENIFIYFLTEVLGSMLHARPHRLVCDVIGLFSFNELSIEIFFSCEMSTPNRFRSVLLKPAEKN